MIWEPFNVHYSIFVSSNGVLCHACNIFHWEESFSLESWWRHQMEIFSALLVRCAGNSPVTGEFPHKGQLRGALMFSLICAWTNGWVNNRDADHYDVTVIECLNGWFVYLSQLVGLLTKWLVTRSFDVFFDLRLNKRLSKHQWSWWI